MRVITFREALNEAIREEMRRDKNVILIGEEVGFYEGAYKVSKGLLKEFGEERVKDTPIAEEAIAGVTIGASNLGLRVIAEMMTFNFALLALDQIVNNAAKLLYMSAGQINTPCVIRGAGGAARQLGAQHSQALETMYTYFPGLKVVMPATPYDGKGLLKSAIRDDNPVIFIESEVLYGLKGEVPEEEYLIPLGEGDIKRPGRDVTIIAHSKMVHLALQTAEVLSKEGIEAEVIDPRTVKPLDEELFFESVRKTNRCVIVEEGWRYAGIGAEFADRIYQNVFDELDAPIIRITQKEAPMPFAPNLEKLNLPSVPEVIDAVKQVMYL